MKRILVVTSTTDTHCDAVTLEIRKLGYDIIRLNSENIEQNITFTVKEKDTILGFDFLIKDSEISFSENSFDTVWFRKPNAIEVQNPNYESSINEYITAEYKQFVQAFYQMCSSKNWVNDIWANRKAGHKPFNLQLAKNLGIKTPKTLITNKIYEAESFAKLCHWNVITKPFIFSGFNIGETHFCPFAYKINQEKFYEFAESIPLAPVFLQEYIEKKLELRVTVIGSEIFTAAIHSQENEFSKYDFRGHDAYELKHTVFQLPNSLKSKILAFNNFLGLKFSTFDFILTPDDEYFFLECNPNGQWLWIEDLTGMPMAKAMAEYLVRI